VITKWLLEENRAGVGVKFNLGATRLKVHVLKTKARGNIQSNKI
jgi:hypothetical protein